MLYNDPVVLKKRRMMNFRVSDEEYDRIVTECERKQVTHTELFREWVRSLPTPGTATATEAGDDAAGKSHVPADAK